jgi:hypothetical protein
VPRLPAADTKKPAISKAKTKQDGRKAKDDVIPSFSLLEETMVVLDATEWPTLDSLKATKKSKRR